MRTSPRFALFVTSVAAAAVLYSPATHALGPLPEIPGKLFPQMPAEWLPPPPNETGFTLGDLLDQKFWTGAKHPLTTNLLKEIGTEMHRAPRPGVQFELFKPGDAGATIHIRW